ncbi:hypothetical protein VaNZ11_012199 [Volvox africanus]|uniref:Transcription factor CBF/NF-Y/archaeal histone domain-containing protein n=1 Tax=Volvox africanus TaxID=51714 RepID=A0ABQ5SF69_9CHLO|nr:hypothetical protein VaNZ11_012199 [Volvox africanus]
MKTRKICPLATRIKKMMQTDDDVGKISQATPILIGRAMELFLEKLCKQAIVVAQTRQAKTLTPSHLKAAVKADTTLDFLAELVAPAPDLPAAETENGDAAPKPSKRRRTNDNYDAVASPEGSGRGRGRGGAAATSGQASDDTPPGPPAQGRGSKPPLPPGSQAPSSRGAGSAKKESSGRRGPRGKAAAAAATAAAAPIIEGPEAGPPDAAELTASVLHMPALPVVQVPPSEAPVPGPSTSSGLAALKGQETAVKHEATSRQDPAAAGSSGIAASGGGCSIVAALRAQQPFFGLGRKGKNLGNKSSGGAITPSSTGTQSHPPSLHQQYAQHTSPQPGLEASVCATTAEATCMDDRRQLQMARVLPVKLEPLDRSASGTFAAAQDAASSRYGDHGQAAQPSPFGHRGLSSGAAGPTMTGTGPEVWGGEDAGMAPGQLSMVGSSVGPLAATAGVMMSGVAQVPHAVAGVGTLMAPLGASLAFFQAPQQQGDVDDDYDDY